MKAIILSVFLCLTFKTSYADDEWMAGASGFLDGFNQTFQQYQRRKYGNDLEVQRMNQEYQMKQRIEQQRRDSVQSYYSQGFADGRKDILDFLIYYVDFVKGARENKEIYIFDFEQLYKDMSHKNLNWSQLSKIIAVIYGGGASIQDVKILEEAIYGGDKMGINYSKSITKVYKPKQ